jgi:hypothetical protein
MPSWARYPLFVQQGGLKTVMKARSVRKGTWRRMDFGRLRYARGRCGLAMAPGEFTEGMA